MDFILRSLGFVRSFFVRRLFSATSYLRSRSLHPISRRYGFDRGKPIDRFFIEKFVRENKALITGSCLEIDNAFYTKKFGLPAAVTKSDVLDVVPNRHANIRGDIRDLSGIVGDDSYDCIILTQTLNVVDDYESSLKEVFRILKPGGSLLATFPTMSQASSARNRETNMWRFTRESLDFVFRQCFPNSSVEISCLGNRSTLKRFWLGMSVEDAGSSGLGKDDQNFPVILGVVAKKAD